jgi:hypothetical protein
MGDYTNEGWQMLWRWFIDNALARWSLCRRGGPMIRLPDAQLKLHFFFCIAANVA